VPKVHLQPLEGGKGPVRTDGAGRNHDFLDWLHGRGVQYSVGFTLPEVSPSCTP
jgi:hypothetical protein